jgi:hypothetical protein
MRLQRTVRRLRRKVRRQERAIRLRVEMLELLEQLEHPPLLAPPPPEPDPMPEWEPPPPLTAAEMEELRALPMPDPLEEIEYRLGLSTTPPSQRTSAD